MLIEPLLVPAQAAVEDAVAFSEYSVIVWLSKIFKQELKLTSRICKV